MTKIVAVAGGFDPFRRGHLHHLKKARALGDFLIVLVSNDEDMKRKKGYCCLPLYERIELISEYPFVDAVIATIDRDGTQAETLRMIKPDIFAKGGDRTPGNMPQNEIDACKEIGCQIVYGVGDLETSSSKMVEDILKQLGVSSDLVRKAMEKL